MHRESLESHLNELRLRLATVYDFQGDRGMVDFLVGYVTSNGNEPDEEEEVIEHDPIDDPILRILADLNFKRPKELDRAPLELMPGKVPVVSSTMNIGKPPGSVS